MLRVPLHKRVLRILLVTAALCSAGRAWSEPGKALADDPDFIRLRASLIALEQVQVIDGSRPQPFSAPRLYLAAGVTTIRTAGSDFPYHDLNLKRGEQHPFARHKRQPASGLPGAVCSRCC